MNCQQRDLPFLPGNSFNFDRNINFRKQKYFEKYQDVRFITTDIKKGMSGKINDRYPSIYCKGEVSDLPSWICFDNQVLRFDAYFQETLQEFYPAPFQVRKCKIYFYLEDGTVKIIEPKVKNSGIPQGTLLNRQRVRLAPPKDALFYDIIDFNIGKTVEIYGKCFKIVNCDKFTRNFLNQLGIIVPDPIDFPEDPYFLHRQKGLDLVLPRKPGRKVNSFINFYKNDKKVLRFFGYWDDRSSEQGVLHNLVLHYYLADDTIEIKKILNDGGCKKRVLVFLKRGKLRKHYEDELAGPGYFDESSVLNVMHSERGVRYLPDTLNAGVNSTNATYKEYDLGIGASINVYGRKMVLVDCDEFTKQFYQAKYGQEKFNAVQKPKEEPSIVFTPIHKRKLPPWNGFGSYEDSAQNCITVEPKAVNHGFKKFLTLDREGMDSRILRFQALLLNRTPHKRKFVLCYYLCDDTISVHESEGFIGRPFIKKQKAYLPGQNLYSSETPQSYEAQDMYVGAIVSINCFNFVLSDADEYALRYMEINANQFPKANISLILEKLRKKLKPNFKEFMKEFIINENQIISYGTFREKISTIMGTEDWSEHEMITVARHFSGVCQTKRHSPTFIRRVVLTQIKKNLWDDIIRMKETFKQFDQKKSGYLSKKDIYTLIKACKLPLDRILIENMIDVLEKNENDEIEGESLFRFIDINYNPVPDTIPLNIKNEFWKYNEKEPVEGRVIDWCAFTKALDLESNLKNPEQPSE